MATTKKILWPIHPAGQTDEGDKQMLSFLEAFSKEQPCSIQPIHVISSDFFVASEYFEPIDVNGLKDNIKKDCLSYLEKFKTVDLLPPLVLDNSYSARGAEVQLLCEFIKDNEPDFVLLNSHGRKGWSRVFVGSFAEKLISKVEQPVIVIGPKCEPVQSLKTALMPVELSESSQQFVEKFLDDHRLSFVENLTLFHKVSMVDLEDITWAPTLYGLSDFTSGDVWKQAKDTAEKFLSSFQDHPLSQKRIHHKISENLDAVATVINEEAKTFDLVVMRSQAGGLEASLLGSVAREVIRDSHRPVIVY